MPNFQAISKTIHARKRWKHSGNYSFAAHDAIVPLVAQEFPRALTHLPIGFTKQQKEFVPVAILGLQPGQNLFVDVDGRWIGGYIPADFRSYPFRLAESADKQSVLVIDEDSGFVNEAYGDAFFDEDGSPTKAVKDVLDFLVSVQTNRVLTRRICAELEEQKLIQPWQITVQSDDGEQSLDGLYRIDEAAMNALAADAFEALRQAGALPFAYCQLISMQHIQTFGPRTEAHRKAAEQVSMGSELNFELLSDNGTISFGPR
ncbi:MAG: peptidase [Gammaproteobacteria bacterium RIFCSPLOWO2_02_FULL_57_10]|nr:MAG: peptidase [Gammaproteobacteria bacterium RIFCSPLOWO2_02_FULL_57_10]